MTGAERMAEWLNGSDTGMSSKAIFHYMTLGVKNGAAPSDSADLGRCVRLLDRFPEWQPRMPEMSCVSDDWAALMSIWADLVRAYRDDVARADKTWTSYEMLSELWWDKSQSGIWTRRKHGFVATPTGDAP